MKPVKSFCALTLALLLAFPLAACGTDDPAAGISSSALPGGSVQSANTLPQEESTQPAVTSEAGENGSSSLPEEDGPKPREATVLKCAKREDGTWHLMVTSGDGLATLICSEVDETAGALTPGALVRITGVIGEMMSYPGQLYGKNICVTVIEPGENFIGLYLDMLNYLYDEEQSMNPEGSPDYSITYGLDLNGVHNLSAEEKNALAYFFSCGHDTDWGAGEQPAGCGLATFENLWYEGRIDKKARRFEHGILFTIQDEPAENGSFSFSMKKWRSDTEFVSHENCKATKGEDGWTFEALDESEQDGNP